MDRRLPCPEAMKTCRVLVMKSPSEEEIGPAALLVKETFPHMYIPVNFWKDKIQKDRTMIIKENDEKVVGVISMSRVKNGNASINLLAVQPAYQGSGIGSLLLDDAENWATSSGKKEVHLMTEQAKTENVAFYSKHGYKVTGYDPHGYSHSPAIHFTKKL